MSADRCNNPHVLREYLDEWCGGTEPPTIVTGYADDLEAAVDIFGSDTDIHDGFMHAPERTVRFSMLDNKLTLERVELLARNAVQQMVIKEGN